MSDRRLDELAALDPLDARSPWLVGFFGWMMARNVARDFHALRLAGDTPDLPPARPVVIYANHPSWWDPAVFVVLTTRLFAGRRGYGPIDIEALAQYRFMSRIGLFGVEPVGRRGASRFLHTSLRILDDCRSLLWITPEGAFTDPRERPVRLRPGLAHLVRRSPHPVVVPLALEYVFWTERKPEVLCRFGAVIDPLDLDDRSPAAWSDYLAASLERTMDALAGEAVARDPDRFRVVLGGSSGIGGVYDLWRRLLALLRNERFHPEHGRPEHERAERHRSERHRRGQSRAGLGGIGPGRPGAGRS